MALGSGALRDCTERKFGVLLGDFQNKKAVSKKLHKEEAQW